MSEYDQWYGSGWYMHNNPLEKNFDFTLALCTWCALVCYSLEASLGDKEQESGG